MNFASIITGLIILVIVWFSIRSLIREKKSGNCSCGCSSCCEKRQHCMTSVNERGDSK